MKQQRDKQKFSSQMDTLLLEGLKSIASQEGRQLQALLEEAVADYIDKKTNQSPREHIKAHLASSMERNRRLGELLAK